MRGLDVQRRVLRLPKRLRPKAARSPARLAPISPRRRSHRRQTRPRPGRQGAQSLTRNGHGEAVAPQDVEVPVLERGQPGDVLVTDLVPLGANAGDVQLTVGEDAELHWLLEPLIAAAGSDLRMTTRFELATGARLVLPDEQILGRAGEEPGRLVVRIAYGVLHGRCSTRSCPPAPVPPAAGGDRRYCTAPGWPGDSSSSNRSSTTSHPRRGPSGTIREKARPCARRSPAPPRSSPPSHRTGFGCGGC
jgi:hypothetical protein